MDHMRGMNERKRPRGSDGASEDAPKKCCGCTNNTGMCGDKKQGDSQDGSEKSGASPDPSFPPVMRFSFVDAKKLVKSITGTNIGRPPGRVSTGVMFDRPVHSVQIRAEGIHPSTSVGTFPQSVTAMIIQTDGFVDHASVCWDIVQRYAESFGAESIMPCPQLR